ncbi:MAG: lipocalin family protein [Bacteroidota bacterium]
MRTIKLVLYILFVAAGSFLLLSIVKAPDDRDIVVVKPFDLQKYLGKWYEIARLDYKYEKNLDNVTATYSLKEDGTVKVDNKGYNYKKEKWEESVGKAKPVNDANEGKLKVSFFGPFYSDYNVIALDENYKYALVAGESNDYLWILSREKTIPESIKTDYIKKAQNLGYKTENLVWVNHDKD